jgi:hypothetical protein
VEVPSGPGRSAAVIGLRDACAANGRLPALVLQTPCPESDARRLSSRAAWPWAVLAVVLLVGLISLRYVEVVFKKPGLIRKLADIRTAQNRLPQVDRELAFLQHLETNQPPYLTVLAVLGDAAARGTLIETLSMNRLGELSFRGTMPNSKEATDFRAKLISSGWFDSVVLEEQSPIINQQKVTVKISAHWRRSPGRAAPDSPSATTNTTLENAALNPATPSPAQPGTPLNPTLITTESED